jgi:NDP-sugar pyrophosphorylase family protein
MLAKYYSSRCGVASANQVGGSVVDSDRRVVVLAGGQGVRMGRLGQLVSKAMLIAYDQPILIRLLRQIITAGFSRILISTDPGHYQQLRALITEYVVSARTEAASSIEVISNPAHEKGPIEAFGKAVEYVGDSRCMMCLGDIFFRDNPFVAFANVDAEDDYLGVAEPVVPADLLQGGLVYCRDGTVEAVVECPQSDSKKGKRWSGVALFGQRLREDLESFVSLCPEGSRMGDFLDFRRKRGRSLRALVGSDFVNINSTEHLLLATLYAAIGAHDSQVELSDLLRQTALHLREAIPRRED